ncbi:hypothetical protein ACIRP0_06965 [Streptomyces sp. NPDC101733]|uniref:hypothetical protein n=1 Tax=unclassified Streptomyces TaxID=2593676 RepID=UPI00380433E5
MHVRPRILIVALVLTTALAGCREARAEPEHHRAPPVAPVADPPTPNSAPVLPRPVAPSPVAPAAAESPRPSSPVPTPPPPAAPAAPAPTTVLSLSVAARPGGLVLERGGPAQEFTVTLRNGNTREYGHLLLAFQMETLQPEPGDTPGPRASVVLERLDPATGRWSPVELRIANDLKPYGSYAGGTRLGREAVRTDRYRVRAGATGPTGGSPLMISAIDTDAPAGAPEELARPGRSSLPQSIRRGS